MKKYIIILSVFCMSLLFCACEKEKSVSGKSVNITGTWTQTNADSDSYFVLELMDDGSGSLMTEPEDIGLPLDYEFDGTSIMTHMGSADDNTPMEYIKDSDEIHFEDVIFKRK